MGVSSIGQFTQTCGRGFARCPSKGPAVLPKGERLCPRCKGRLRSEDQATTIAWRFYLWEGVRGKQSTPATNGSRKLVPATSSCQSARPRAPRLVAFLLGNDDCLTHGKRAGFGNLHVVMPAVGSRWNRAMVANCLMLSRPPYAEHYKLYFASKYSQKNGWTHLQAAGNSRDPSTRNPRKLHGSKAWRPAASKAVGDSEVAASLFSHDRVRVYRVYSVCSV